MKSSLTLLNIVVIGLAAALTIGVQVALSVIPNIELVTLFFILFTLNFRSKALYIIYIFAAVECLIYPPGLWCIAYLYIWTILYLMVRILRESSSALFWAVIGAIYGLLFGTLSSIPYFFTSGVSGGLAYIVAGFGYDLLHCIGNFIVILVLFKPLNTILGRLPFFTEKQ